MTTISVMNSTLEKKKGGKIIGEKEKARSKRKGREMTGKAQGLTTSLYPDSSIFLTDAVYSEIVPVVWL